MISFPHWHLSSDLGLSKYVNQHSHLNLSRNVRLSVLYDLDFNMSVLSNEWGHMGICLRKQQSIANTPAKLVYPVDTMRDDINLQLFEHLFPKQFIENIMIPEIEECCDIQ